MKKYVKKIYITIPMELFNEFYKREEIENMDNIICALLYKYFDMEERG